MLQHQYPYEYRLAADFASLLTVIGNALRCPAQICCNKDIRVQLFELLQKPKVHFLVPNATMTLPLIQPQEKLAIRRHSEKIENPAWISVLLINHDDDKHGNETTACIRKNGLQAVFERDNIRRLSNIGIC